VLPEVPEKALRTVSGRFSVRVRVQVDTNGEVTSAQLDSPGPSRYFANLALDAARLWKFAAGGSDRRRLIEFEFSPAGAQVIAVR
jgi:TonB family protein